MKKRTTALIALTLAMCLALLPMDALAASKAKAKAALAISDIAEGKYTGTLSGDSYEGNKHDGQYSIDPDISPAEITVTIKGGKIKLYSEASVSSSGSVRGIDAPRSPEYKQTASGTLKLKQVNKTTIRAKGKIASTGEQPYINWDGNNRFTHWDIEPLEEGTYECAVSITMEKGVPTADIKIDGSASSRSCKIPLRLK